MPKFSVDDSIEIEPDEYLDECDSDDIKQVVDYLIDGGWIPKNTILKKDGKMSIPESMFQEHLDAIGSNYHSLTNDEEKIITEIGKKFKI